MKKLRVKVIIWLNTNIIQLLATANTVGLITLLIIFIILTDMDSKEIIIIIRINKTQIIMKIRTLKLRMEKVGL